MRRFLLIVLVLILAGGAVWYFIIRPKQQAAANPAGNGGFPVFFSLGNKPSDTIPADEMVPANQGQVVSVNQIVNPFKQVSAGAVAGFVSYDITKTITIPATTPKGKPTKQTITQHVIRYVSRSNGYVYEIIDGGVPTQITNIFIPNIYEAYFADGNKTVIVRFLRDDNETIATYSIPIPEPNPDGTRTQREGVYLPDNINSVAVSPDQKLVARLTIDKSNATISTSDSKGGAVKTILQNPFHEWLLSWGNQLYVQTKASAFANGYLYRIDQTGKRLMRTIGNVPGLTTSVSPKGTYVLYSQSSGNSFSTKLLSTKTNVTKDISISALPEKCVWLVTEDAICAGSDSILPATYPDDWYKGVTSFSDKLYRIYTGTGILSTLNDGSPYDMTNLSYSESQNILYFIDKNTGLLWQYSL